MPLFWLCIAFIIGLYSSAYLDLPDILWLSLFILFAAAGQLEKHLSAGKHHPLIAQPLFRIPFCLLLAAFSLGVWRFQSALPVFSEDDLAWYGEGDTLTVIGRVSSYPQESPSGTTAIVKAQSINFEGKFVEVQGKLELRLPAGFNLSYGDKLLLEGPLNSVSKSADKPFLSYLSRKGIYNRMYYPQVTTIDRGCGNRLIAWIYNLREESLERIYSQIPFPESALMSGILLGTDWLIPPAYENAYRACGLIHIIAISGFNIALISNFIIKATRLFLSPGKAGIVAIAAISLYTVMAGAEPAVVRAALMGCLAIPAHYVGRRPIPIHSLVVVGAIMLLGNPFLLWDAGFQLSFLACLGLITMADPLQNFTVGLLARFLSESTVNWWKPILSLVINTLVAQFAVLPVILNMDTSISMYSLAANLTVLPMQSILMILGALSVVFGWFLPGISRILAIATWPFLAYSNRLALHFGYLPDAQTTLPSSSATIVLFIVPPTLFVFLILHIHRLNQKHIPDQENV